MGRAEIYFNGQWGTICGLYWDWEDKEADIFCQELGYIGGVRTITRNPGPKDYPIWMTGVECSGNEKSFRECRASWDPRIISRSCNHTYDAGVSCYKSGRPFSLSL